MNASIITRAIAVTALAAVGLATLALANIADSDPPVASAQQLTVEIPEAWQGGGITVNGTGSVEVEANVANVSIGVDVIAPTVREARDQAATKLAAMIDAITSQGVAADDITTSRLNIRPETVWVEEEIELGDGEVARSRRSRIIGYRVTNRLDVSVRDVETIGDVIDSAADVGGDATRIDNIYFTADDTSDAAVSARQLAAANARATATLYANALGVRLGPIVSLTETGADAPIGFQNDSFGFAVETAALRSVETPVSSGNVTITANIRATFSILGVVPELQSP